MTLHLFFYTQEMFASSPENVILCEKIAGAFLILSGITFSFMLEQLTKYQMKPIIKYSILFFGFISTLLNFTSSGTIQFSEITIKTIQIFNLESISVAQGNFSETFIFVILLLIPFTYQTYKSLIFYYKNDPFSTKLLIISIFASLGLILMNVFLINTDFRWIVIFRNYGYLGFTLVIFNRNIKQILRTEDIYEELLESENTLKRIIEITDDAIWEMNLETDKVYTSIKLGQMLGYNPNEFTITKELFSELLHPDDEKIITQSIDSLKRGDITKYINEYRIRTKEGSWKWLELRAEVVEFFENKTPKRILGVHTDIHYRKSNEEVLRKNEQKFRNLFEHGTDAHLLISNDFIIDCNKAAIDLFQCSREYLIGKRLDQISPEFQSEGDSSKVKADFIYEETVKSCGYKTEWLLIRPDNTEFWAETVLTSIDIDSSLIIHINLRDISERKNLVKKMNKQIRQQKLIRELGIVASRVFDVFTLYKTVYKFIPEYLEVSRASILRYDKETKSLMSEKEFGIIREDINVKSGVQASNFSISGKCFTENRPIIVNDCSKTDLIPEAHVKGLNLKSCLAVPIISKGTPIGVLRIDDCESINRFGEEDVELYSIISDQLAVIFENIQLFTKLIEGEKKLKHVYSRLELISNVTSTVISTEPLKIQISKYFDLIKNAFKIDVCILRIIEGDYLVIKAVSGVDKENLAPKIKTDFGISKVIIETLKPFAVKDFSEHIVTKDDRYSVPNTFEAKSYLGAPLIIQEKIFGILGIYTEDVIREFTDTDKEHLQIIANHLSIIIENNDLIKDLKAQKSILEKELIEKEQLSAVLRESERKFRAIITNTPIVFFILDKDGVFLLSEGTGLLRLGLKPGQVVGLSAYDVYKDFPSICESVKNALNGVPTRDEANINGIVFDVLYTPHYNEKNELIGVIGIANDLTERKAAESEMKNSYESLKAIFDNSPFGMIIADFETNQIIQVNNSLLKILKKKKEDLYGKTTDAGISFKNKEYAYALFAKNGYLENLEVTFTDTENNKRVALISTQVIKYRNKLATLSVINDITEKKITEKRLTEANRYINYIINSIPLIIISIDSSHKVIHYNTFAKKYITNELIESTEKHNISELFSKLRFIEDVIDKSVKNNSPLVESRMVNDENNNIKHFNISIFPMLLDNEPGNVILVEDVTEKIQIEQLMIQTEKMMSIAGLAAGMAHEINNPLGTISQGCQNLIRRTSSDLPKNNEIAQSVGIQISQLEEYLKERDIYLIIESIRNAAAKASEIIKNMLQFSRKSESKKVSYDIAKIIEEVLELAYNDYNLKKRYDFRSIHISVDIEKNLPLIWLTVTEIQQVLFNILQNAAQAFKQENIPSKIYEINIGVKKITDLLVISIEDNGPGMTDEVKSRIFEPFFTTKDVGEGTGLGLSVSYMIIKNNHGGTISVESEKGKGTTFLIKIPYKEKRDE